MPTIEQAQALGRVIDRQRKLRGIKSVRALAKNAGISPQRLSEIINAYQRPNRGFTVPTDETLERLAHALEVPVAMLHAPLGRSSDAPYLDNSAPAFMNADTMDMAQAYDQLPDFARKMMQDVLTKVQDIATVVATGDPGVPR